MMRSLSIVPLGVVVLLRLLAALSHNVLHGSAGSKDVDRGAVHSFDLGSISSF